MLQVRIRPRGAEDRPQARERARRQPLQVRHGRLDRLAHLALDRRGGELLRQALRRRARAAPLGARGDRRPPIPTSTSSAGSRRRAASPWSGRRRTPARRSSTPCSARRPTPPPAPRMTVRFFGGWDFTAEDATSRLPAAAGYQKGVPMGGDLPAAPEGKAPTFLVAALKDAHSGNLDRIQIVKGWLDAERQHPGKGLRRRLERRPPAGRRRQAAAGRQHRRRRPRHLDQHHRRPRADRRLDRPRLRPGARRPSTTPRSSRSRPRAGPPTRRCASASTCPTTCR